MPHKREEETYRFDELDSEAQEKALDNYRNHQADWVATVFHDLHGVFIIDWAKEAGKLIGLDIHEVEYSVGDRDEGVCMNADYEYAKGSVAAVKKEFPVSRDIHHIAERLQAIQAPQFYGIIASTGCRRGPGSPAMKVEVDRWNEATDSRVPDDVREDVAEQMDRFADWILGRLRNEWEYIWSDEYIIEEIEANEREFDEDGNII